MFLRTLIKINSMLLINCQWIFQAHLKIVIVEFNKILEVNFQIFLQFTFQKFLQVTFQRFYSWILQDTLFTSTNLCTKLLSLKWFIPADKWLRTRSHSSSSRPKLFSGSSNKLNKDPPEKLRKKLFKEFWMSRTLVSYAWTILLWNLCC